MRRRQAAAMRRRKEEEAAFAAQGHWLQSFAIVTTEANELMDRVHPRMPVISICVTTIAGWTGKRRSDCRSICYGLGIGRDGDDGSQSDGRQRAEQWA